MSAHFAVAREDKEGQAMTDDADVHDAGDAVLSVEDVEIYREQLGRDALRRPIWRLFASHEALRAERDALKEAIRSDGMLLDMAATAHWLVAEARADLSLAEQQRDAAMKGLREIEGGDEQAKRRCGVCGLDYHRYSTHDPEHKPNAVACVNTLKGAAASTIAEVEKMAER